LGRSATVKKKDPILTHLSRHSSSSSVNNELHTHSCEDDSLRYTTECCELRPLPLSLGTSYHGAYLIASLKSHMAEWKLLLLPSICILRNGHLDYHFCCPLLTGYKKVKCTLVQALRLCTGRTAHRGSRGIALLLLDHGTRRG
jgi:hypothetical protein